MKVRFGRNVVVTSSVASSEQVASSKQVASSEQVTKKKEIDYRNQTRDAIRSVRGVVFECFSEHQSTHSIVHRYCYENFWNRD